MRFRTTSAPPHGRSISRTAILRRSRRWRMTRCCGWRVPIARRRSSLTRAEPSGPSCPALCRASTSWPHRRRRWPGHLARRRASRFCPAMTRKYTTRSQAISLAGSIPMNLHRLLNARLAAGKPVGVALIGAGKFGSMFLSQVPHTPGLEVSVIVDLDRDRAREACRTVGWDAERIARTAFTDDAVRAIAGGAMDVVVEATGNPAVGIRHARAAIAAGKHVVMVNVEADVLAGPLLAEEARKAVVVYSLAYGDQ